MKKKTFKIGVTFSDGYRKYIVETDDYRPEGFIAYWGNGTGEIITEKPCYVAPNPAQGNGGFIVITEGDWEVVFDTGGCVYLEVLNKDELDKQLEKEGA